MGIMVKEEQCEKVLDARNVCDSDFCYCFEEDERRLISWYAPQSG